MSMGAFSSGCQKDWPRLSGSCAIRPELLSSFLQAVASSKLECTHRFALLPAELIILLALGTEHYCPASCCVERGEGQKCLLSKLQQTQ